MGGDEGGGGAYSKFYPGSSIGTPTGLLRPLPREKYKISELNSSINHVFMDLHKRSFFQ